MNKSLFWSGLGMIGLEITMVLLFLLSTLDYSWLTAQFVGMVVGGLILIGFNIMAVIFMIVGALK